MGLYKIIVLSSLINLLSNEHTSVVSDIVRLLNKNGNRIRGYSKKKKYIYYMTANYPDTHNYQMQNFKYNECFIFFKE